MTLILNEMIPDFEINTVTGENKPFNAIYENNEHTLLLFLRYYGCSVCQLDLQEYKDAYEKYQQQNTEVVIVLQSTPEIINKSGAMFPYVIACDPEQVLYKQFDIMPAKSTLGMLSFKTVGKVLNATRKGIKHGEYEGIELQLPAAFVIDRKGTIKYGKYAQNLADLPTAENFLSMIDGF